MSDYKVTTLLAVTDRLGLELLLVPKGAAAGLDGSAPTAPAVKTRIRAALDKLSHDSPSPDGENTP